MKAVTVAPGRRPSRPAAGGRSADTDAALAVMVEALAAGICGTDAEIASGRLRVAAAGAWTG